MIESEIAPPSLSYVKMRFDNIVSRFSTEKFQDYYSILCLFKSLLISPTLSCKILNIFDRNNITI